MSASATPDPSAPPAAPFDPYAPPRAGLDPAQARVVVLARPGLRLAAYLLDSAIAVVAIVVGIVAAAVVGGVTLTDESLEQLEQLDALPPAVAATLLVPIALFAVVQLVLLQVRGATLGKLPFRLTIRRRDGRRAGLGRTFVLRWLVLAVVGYVLNEWTLVLGSVLTLFIDPLLIFSAQHRTLHDRLAGTIVVRTS